MPITGYTLTPAGRSFRIRFAVAGILVQVIHLHGSSHPLSAYVVAPFAGGVRL